MIKPSASQKPFENLVVPTTNVLGTRITLISKSEMLNIISNTISQNKKRLILSGNTLSLNLAYENTWFRFFLNSADYIRIDGIGLKFASRVLGFEIPERFTWADFIWDLSEYCEKQGYSLYLLGADRGIAREAAERLSKRFPNLQISGTHHGYFDKNRDSHENQQVIQEINNLKPHILIIGFGMPIQEKWLMENWENLGVNIGFTGGAVFDYTSGKLKRAPKWMTENGFEWLGRLLIEPRRLWRRYVYGNPLFIYRVIKQRIFEVQHTSK